MLKKPRVGDVRPQELVGMGAIREDFLEEMLPTVSFEGCGKREQHVQRHRGFP